MIYLVLIIVLLSVALGLNYLYKCTNHFNNQFIDVRKYWQKDGIADNLQIVNLGSNHPKFGFDYTDTGVRGANLAIGPQTFEYDYAVLRKSTSHLAKNAVIVFPICLQKFFLYRQNNRGVHLKYYTFLEPSDIVGYSKKEKFFELGFPLLRHPKRLRYLIKDVKTDNRLEWTDNPMKTGVELEKDADFWIRCWDKEFGIHIPSLDISSKNQEDIHQNIRLMKEMIEYCKKHELKPVIVILPVTESLSSRFSDDYLQTHVLRYVNESAKVGAPVFNYLKDSRFTDSSLYINSFFFNKTGRSVFTKAFVEDLRQNEYL